MADEKNVQVETDEAVEEKTDKKLEIPFPVKAVLGTVAVATGVAMVAWAICSGKGKQVSEVADAAKEVLPEVAEEAVKAAI